MASAKPHPDPLDTLSGMVNGVVGTVGHFFRAPQTRSEQTKTVLAATHKAFDEALDHLQIQILEAKALYEQDLADLRAMRAPKEHPPKEANEIDSKSIEPTSNAGQDTIVEKVIDNPAPQPTNTAEDTLMGDDPVSVTSGDKVEAQEAEASQFIDVTAETVTAVDPVAPALVPNDPAPQEEEPMSDKAPPQKAPEDEAPLSSAISQDINFESMFDEPMGEEAATDINADFNFDLDLPGSGLSASDLTGNDQITSTSANDVVAGGDPTSFNSLLPGLESYANAAGDDFGMLDFSQTAPDENLNTTGKENFEGMPQMQEANAFDELIGDGNIGEGLGDLRGGDGTDDLFNDDALMELGDLDDNWFKND